MRLVLVEAKGRIVGCGGDIKRRQRFIAYGAARRYGKKRRKQWQMRGKATDADAWKRHNADETSGPICLGNRCSH
jgi:hypothetical protein